MSAMELRPDLPRPVPARILALPRSSRGYPVPWFATWLNGEPEFRVADAAKYRRALREERCWVCGQPHGSRYRAFLLGPMCTVNRVCPEPPSHRECAMWSAQACPFLSRPTMHRREAGMPEDGIDAAGIPLLRNAGVVCVWVTREFTIDRIAPRPGEVGNAGTLLHVGDPTQVWWFTDGRLATVEEVRAAFARGLPALREMAEAQDHEQQRADCVPALEAAGRAAEQWIPVSPGVAVMKGRG